MSYSIKEAVLEREDEVSKALDTRDSEKLYQLADLYKGESEDELADYLKNKAKKIERDEWAYDESKDEATIDSYTQ